MCEHACVSPLPFVSETLLINLFHMNEDGNKLLRLLKLLAAAFAQVLAFETAVGATYYTLNTTHYTLHSTL